LKKVTIIIFCIFITSCQKSDKAILTDTTQDAIIKKYLHNGAWNHHYLSKEWDEWINKGINEDSTIAYLWQQKALPFWKQKKYELAIKYYEKAVDLDRQQWLSRLAFLKCIFAKDYSEALNDLIAYKNEYGSTYEQDHTLEFYMGICYLQLNQFENAFMILKENVDIQEKEYGVSWVHFLDRYYLAVAYYELDNFAMAISEFDKVLKEYHNFSDAQYYKSICLNYLGEKEEAKVLITQGKLNFEKGNTFNEDSNLYEIYPYQITWQWEVVQSILK